MHHDSHLLHAGDVVLDLLDEAHLVQLIAAVLDVAQEHLGFANLNIFIVYISTFVSICDFHLG